MISDLAREALREAIALNPDAARLLRAILRTSPRSVKYKPEDPFGPLSMMVAQSSSVRQLPSELRGYVKPALPNQFHRGAEIFQHEWLAGVFSKSELAHEIEIRLHELGEAVPDIGGPWRVTRPASPPGSTEDG